MSKLDNTTVIQRRVYSFLGRCAMLWAATVIFALALEPNQTHSADAQALAKRSEILVYATPDVTSSLVETVHDGGMLSPIAETTSEGVKWFMVKTKTGNMGWIKANSNVETKPIDDHFRALPKEILSVGPPNSAPEPAMKTSEKGAYRIPILIRGPRVYVAVTFNRRVSRYLQVDTGMYQTVISKRVATELGLSAIDRGITYGVAGPVRHDIGLLDSIRVGASEVRNFRVSVFDHTTVPNDDGLLGFDFLGLFQMSVDPEKQEMVLTARKK
jgi:Aspartyl protease